MNQVQDSSDCCINSKFSSAQKGYFQDDFLSLYIKKLHPRSPIINRGYYIRFKAIDEVFQSWWCPINLCSYQKFQIISLGAGYDSSYIRLKNNKQLPPGCHYIEIDFPDVMKRKFELIKDAISTNKDIPLEPNPAIVLCTEGYFMLGIDLTNIPALQKCLTDIGIDYSIPTLFLSECSITYIDPNYSEALISWVQYYFPHSIFVAYEQVYPDDAFGIIMRNHFTQVGCSLKSITKYPDEVSQSKRFKKLGWTDCTVITMYDFFNSLSPEEKHRIQQLEMFDEYEMWHEKCHHYVLLWASQGIFSKCLPPSLTIRNIVHTEQNVSVKKTLNWKYVDTDVVAQRFGHQVIPVSSSVIMISGGFGMVNKRHQRLGDISLYNMESKEHIKISLEDQKFVMGNRMFHTTTKLSNNAIVILGGRSSPKKIFSEVLVLYNHCPLVVTEADNISIDTISQLPSENLHSFQSATYELSMPVPLWRHSASLVDIEGIEYIFVFGGCSEDHSATNDCFSLNTETWKWTKVNVQEHTPCPRHSHSAVTYNKDNFIITGGLTEEETILQSVYLFNTITLEWSCITVSGLLPRYSHTSHIWNDYMFLVGGVTNVANFKLGIGVVNLKTLQAFEIHSPAQDPEFPILLCNHSSYIEGDEIFIVGGGGNCFSFGTHFNKKIVCFNVNYLTEGMF